jgi:hypothetical protein
MPHKARLGSGQISEYVHLLKDADVGAIAVLLIEGSLLSRGGKLAAAPWAIALARAS